MERNSLDTSKYMKLALHLAKKSYRRGEIPVGAVVVLHGKVVGYGYNLKETLNDARACRTSRLKDGCENSWHLPFGRDKDVYNP